MATSRNEIYDQPGTLMMRTMELVRERNLTEVVVGTRLPHYWLYGFRKGLITNPSVNRVQILYEFLTGKQIVDEKQ